jgi:uncharacterized protein
MSQRNKSILQEANAAISKGNIEGFLSFCAEDIEWTTVGEETIKGKEALRQWMATAYVEPPEYTLVNLIAEGDFLVALGDITLKDKEGKPRNHAYCDVWRFRDDKMVELRAFVVEAQ